LEVTYRVVLAYGLWRAGEIKLMVGTTDILRSKDKTEILTNCELMYLISAINF
jgi:hypothetical protein